MTAPRILMAVTKGCFFAGAVYAISETELPEKIVDSVNDFNKQHRTYSSPTISTAFHALCYSAFYVGSGDILINPSVITENK